MQLAHNLKPAQASEIDKNVFSAPMIIQAECDGAGIFVSECVAVGE
jgi:hypothetical protein